MTCVCYIIALFLISPLYCHGGNTTNIFDIRDEYNIVKRYVAIILFSLLLLYGFISNTMMVIGFCSRDRLYNQTLILILSQLIISSFLNFVSQIIIVLFGMLKTEIDDAYMLTWIHSIFTSMNTFSFFAMLHFTLLLAVNRLVVINLPEFNVFFESVKFYFLLACIWLSVLVISLVEFHYCIKNFNVSNLQWSINCTKRTLENGAIFMKIRYVWVLTLPITMFAVYIPIFYHMHHKRKNFLKLSKTSGCEAKNTATTGKYERLMLIQAVLICGAIEIQIICFNFLMKFAVKLGGKKVEIPVNIFINCCVIFNGSMLPTANLIFVKRVRENMKHIIINLFLKFKDMKKMSTVVPLSASRKFSFMR